MKRRSVFILNSDFEIKKHKCEKSRDARLLEFETWCTNQSVKIAEAVKFDSNCIAGHGMRATADIPAGMELVRIPRAATIYHSKRLENAFKVCSVSANITGGTRPFLCPSQSTSVRISWP